MKRAAALATLTLVFGWSVAALAQDTPAVRGAIGELGAEHDEALSAVRVLQRGGARAAEGIRDAWPTLSLLAQRRAVEALRPLATEHDAAVDALVQAARSTDETIRDKALAALRQGAPRGRDGLVALLDDPAVGDRAATTLARNEPDFAVRPLLAALEREGGSERAGLRSALVIAVRRSETADRELAAWLRTRPPASAVASASLALELVETHRAALREMLEYAARDANDFATRWRVLQSVGVAGPSQELDQWVQSQVTGPEEWMLRRAAVEAITARGHRERARGSLGDPYPRVRQSAALSLSADPDSMLERAALARRDTWPMVRASAVLSLRSEAEATPVLVAAVDDSMSEVRVAAISVLSTASHEEGWDRIHRRLRDRNEWPNVTAAAVGYVVSHCRSDAAEALFGVVMRATPSNALTEDLNNAALAIEALRVLDSPEARAVVEGLRSTPGVPPTLKMALEQPLAGDRSCSKGAR